ncbi:hypothetical protein BH11PSE3_BH11PSE3_17860 [soil metagenome]
MGQNYLAVCDGARGARAEEAKEVAAAIRAVMNGDIKDASLEYPCNSPTERRWFQLSVLPFGGASRQGAILSHTNITDRKVPELELLNSEREQRALAERLALEQEMLLTAQAIAKVGSWELDLKTLDASWSAETFKIFEATRADFAPSQSRFLSFVHPDDREALTTALLQSHGTTEVSRIEHRLLMGDGRIKVVVERWRTYCDPAGTPVRAVGTCEDITERHASDAKLRDTEERYRMLFDANPFPTVVVDRETRRFLAINDAMVTNYGWSRAELATMTSDDIYTPEDLPTVVALREGFALDSTHEVPRLHHRRKDGTILDVDQTVRTIDFGGRPAVLATAFDMTDRNRTLAELQRSEERYRALVDTLPVGVLESTADGRIVSVNGAWRRMFGFADSDDVSAVDVADLYGDPADRITLMAQAEGGQLPAEAETVFRRRDGTVFPAERYFRKVVDAEDKVVGLRGIVIDVTKRKALEARLNQSQKMEAVGQLTGGIAHDFNNILMVILGNVDALEDETALSPYVRERIDQIDQAGQRAADLTRSLLAFSHKLPLHPRRTDMNELVVTVGKLLRRTLGARIEIDSVLGEDLWLVQVDRGQLENALVNLCVNARDAMPAGGRLLIETRNHPKGPGETLGDFVVLSVTDSGSGIPPEVLAKVFEPFFTTKGVGKGTGLGLSMVHGFINQSKGHIEIKSTVGQGTSVIMSLPRTEGVPEDEAASIVGPLPRGDEEILVVEDEDRVRTVVVQQLLSLGYAVASAADGVSGLAACQSASRPYDLLLTDVIVPGPLNGKALADEVVRRWPRTRVLFMSGYSQDTIVHEGRPDPGVMLLAKPFRKLDLALAVRSALKGG